MEDDVDARDVDDALKVAEKRTAQAQRHVEVVVEEGLVPPPPVVEDVVQRAEDLRDLAGDASHPER
jgi:hypothetical protein